MSYAERLFNYREIGALDARAAAAALTVPAEERGVHFEDSAIDAIITAARGYPYFLQTYRQAAWNIAADRTITTKDAEAAIIDGNAQLDMGFFPPAGTVQPHRNGITSGPWPKTARMGPRPARSLNDCRLDPRV